MTDFRNPFNYPLNPTFGQGIFRRRIRLEQHEGYVSGALEDCNHGFAVKIYHDGKTITNVEGTPHRIPFSTCSGAIEPMQVLVGIEVGLTAQQLAERINPRANCTHWLDLALLAVMHIPRVEEAYRQYDITIPDELDVPTTVTVARNGETVLHWQVQDWTVLEAEPLQGKTLFKGFSAWANSLFEDADTKEAVFILQKGYFVSRARRFNTNVMAGESAAAHATMFDACFTYSEPRRSVAERTAATTYDFTDTEEQLLKFVQPVTTK